MSKRHYLYVALVLLGLIALAGCTGSENKSADQAQPSKEQPSIAKSASKTTGGGTAQAAGTTQSTAPQAAVKPQSPVAPEVNPPGDIPDNQAFVAYQSTAGHFQVKVPEGWSRATLKSTVDFSDKLNSVSIKWAPSPQAPTVEQAKTTEAQALSRTELAFKLVGVQQVSLPGGQAVLIKYQENSDPNPVTGKQYRMDVLRYEFYKSGTQANLTLTSPVGADNVDPWKIVSESFKWQ